MIRCSHEPRCGPAIAGSRIPVATSKLKPKTAGEALRRAIVVVAGMVEKVRATRQRSGSSGEGGPGRGDPNTGA